MASSLSLLFSLLLFASATTAAVLPVAKDLAGLPGDFPFFTLPSPLSSSLLERSKLLHFAPKLLDTQHEEGPKASWDVFYAESPFLVDVNTSFVMTLFAICSISFLPSVASKSLFFSVAARQNFITDAAAAGDDCRYGVGIFDPNGVFVPVTSDMILDSQPFPLGDNVKSGPAANVIPDAVSVAFGDYGRSGGDGHVEVGGWTVAAMIAIKKTATALDQAALPASSSPSPPPPPPPFSALVWLDSPLLLYSRLTDYANLTVGRDIGVVGWIVDDDDDGHGQQQQQQQRVPLIDPLPSDSALVTSATLKVKLPCGKVKLYEMKKKSFSSNNNNHYHKNPNTHKNHHPRASQNDSRYEATFLATERGVYTTSVVFYGVTREGIPFERSATRLFTVTLDGLEFDGTATATPVPNDKNRINLALGMEEDGGEHSLERLRVFAQLWGTSTNNGTLSPACWLSTLSPITQGFISRNHPNAAAAASSNHQHNQQLQVSLRADLRWLTSLGLGSPLYLKNVLAQDLLGYIPIATYDSILVTEHDEMGRPAPLQKLSQQPALPQPVEPTFEMRNGRKPVATSASTVQQQEKRGLLLVHGYCSWSNPWEGASGVDWRDPHFFLNAGASVPHDEFAQLVYAYMTENEITQGAWMGHSQGGAVGLHLLNYYHSPLDNPSSLTKRPIQTLGTPYQGSSLAGFWAEIGSIFGMGCGANVDLNPDNAKLWLSGISPEARSKVWIYSTTYVQGKWFGDYCSLATNAILKWPNDGVCELARSRIDGANDAGNSEGECHTHDLAYPAQYLNANRDKEMDENAA